jgi:hypothetical protein
VEFLPTHGTPRYKRPMWLFLAGLKKTTLTDLWRFLIDQLFRFVKQHLRLNAHLSTDLVSTDH